MNHSALRCGPVRGRRALIACTRCRRLKKGCKQVEPLGFDICQRCLKTGEDCHYVKVANDPTAPRSNASGSRAPETVPDSFPITPSDPSPQSFDIYTELPYQQPHAHTVYRPGGPAHLNPPQATEDFSNDPLPFELLDTMFHFGDNTVSSTLPPPSPFPPLQQDLTEHQRPNLHHVTYPTDFFPHTDYGTESQTHFASLPDVWGAIDGNPSFTPTVPTYNQQPPYNSPSPPVSMLAITTNSSFALAHSTPLTRRWDSDDEG